MSKFITGKELNDEIYHIIWDATQQLVLVSPYIRLDKYFRDLLIKHNKNENLHILLVFGKNEGAVNKSLNSDDFEFFKQFPNISIIYQPNLHAKYYGNERKGIITSINLHDHSFENNIEFGVLSVTSFTDNILPTSNLDVKAWQKCLEIADKGVPVFIRRPIIQKKMLGMIKSYIGSDTLHDLTKDFYGREAKSNIQTSKRLDDFPDEIIFEASKKSMPEKEMPIKKAEEPKASNSKSSQQPKKGYCIRTGVEIAYNPERPYTYNAFKEWEVYGNWEYGETYCHRTGEKTKGKTSRLKPILNDSYINKVTLKSSFR